MIDHADGRCGHPASVRGPRDVEDEIGPRGADAQQWEQLKLHATHMSSENFEGGLDAWRRPLELHTEHANFTSTSRRWRGRSMSSRTTTPSSG